MSTSFRIKSTLDGRTDHSATTGLVNSWTVQHGGQDLQRTRQQQRIIKESSKIPNQGTTLIDSTKGDIELWMANAPMEGHTKQIALTSSSRSSMHRILLHTYRGSCYITGTLTLIFAQDGWDSIDGTDLAWFTTRQIDGKLRGTGVVSPYEAIADPVLRQVNALLAKTGRLPPRRGIGQGAAVDVSGDGNCLAIGACNDDYWAGAIGAVWIFVRVPAALNHTIVSALKRGSMPATSAMEARAYNRLVQTMQLAPNPDDIEEAAQNSGSAPLAVNETLADRHLPLQGAQWLQVAKLVGGGVVDFSSSQGFSLSLRSDGQSILVGGPSQNRGAGGVWWFAANEQDGWNEQGRWINGEVLESGDQVLPQQSTEMLGCSVACQPHGPHSIAGGRGLVVIFELTRSLFTLRLEEWSGHALSVDTNNVQIFVGCPDLGKVWIYEWPELLNNTSALPQPLQVLTLLNGNDSGFGTSISSTWLPHRLVVGAHRWSYLAGAAIVYQWHKTERKYVQMQILSDNESPAGSIQGQGSSVAIAGQNGLGIAVGHMLSKEQTGGALQYLWDEMLGKFVMIPKSLLPRNVGEGALTGCSVSCSARGDTILMGCPGDGEHGSAAVFQ